MSNIRIGQRLSGVPWNYRWRESEEYYYEFYNALLCDLILIFLESLQITNKMDHLDV